MAILNLHLQVFCIIITKLDRSAREPRISTNPPNCEAMPEIPVPSRGGDPMKQVTVHRIGLTSLYMRIPIEWARAINLEDNDLAFLVPVAGRLDKFEVTLVKAPVPAELVQEAE